MTSPNPPLGMTDFFALEAGEYLERLDALMHRPEGAGPAAGGDEFVRLARALRGSALMANQHAIARAASGLEALARTLRDGRRAWDAATKQTAVRAVDDVKVFVRRTPAWTDADTAKAEALAAQLEQLAGRTSAQIRAAEALGLDAGARAFVAREGAAIASALDRAGQALRANPLAHDPLQQVLRALQPLRGLAALNDLPPLADLLEGIERVIAELSGAPAKPPPGVPELFQAAATAIARAARDVAERGRPDPEGHEFKWFARLLVKFLDREPDVIAIASLYYGDAGPHVVQRGTPAARPPTLGRLELVSHGEHLRQAADSLERAPSATQRELRAHTLGGTFRALTNAGGGALAERVAHFAVAAREAVTAGIAGTQAGAFANELRRAGDVLARSSGGDEAALATELDAVTAAIRALFGSTSTPTSSPAPAAGAPAGQAQAVAARAPGDADSPAETPDIVGSWVTYRRLVAAGTGPASLDDLLARPSLDTGRPVAVAEPTAVDIRTLLYRGDRALQRARELRQEAHHASGEHLRALVEEVCDLVALALEPASTA